MGLLREENNLTPSMVKGFYKISSPVSPTTTLTDTMILGTNRSCAHSPCVLSQLTLPYLII
jgi:hypothetical protein